MKTLDGKVDYHISVDHSVVIDLPVHSVPESHIKANIVLSTTKRRKRKYANKSNE